MYYIITLKKYNEHCKIEIANKKLIKLTKMKRSTIQLYEPVMEKIRKSQRIRGNIPIQIVEIGENNIPVTDSVLHNYVNCSIIADIPQIISLPIPPSRHAFLVHVKTNEGKIMVSDWGGKTNKTRGTKFKNWRQYSAFIKLLEQKYQLPIEYYDVDIDIKERAEAHHITYKNRREQQGSGGCSYYIFEWLDKYYHQ